MLAAVLIVIVIGHTSGTDACASSNCADDPMATAFQQAARRVLGNEAKLEFEAVTSDPPDQQAVARASTADGVVELSFTPIDNKARVHCYVAKERRWVDREISFGNDRASLQSEAVERGRLLGFAVASMFPSAPPKELAQASMGPSSAAPATAAIVPAPAASAPTSPKASAGSLQRETPTSEERSHRSIEFAGIASSGLHGTAAGLGASAALRLAWTGPVWARAFVAGRTGNIPEAQASTRTALLGVGVALAFLPETQRFELGARLDAFASYFDASHLSEDDISPDTRSRWLAGGDLLAEAGVRVSGGAGILLAAGVEAMLGKTDIYTHGNRVAVVPPFRAIAELGFRTRF